MRHTSGPIGIEVIASPPMAPRGEPGLRVTRAQAGREHAARRRVAL